MYYKLIKNNISKLNSTITKNFLNKNGIYLSDDNNLFVCNLFKENWEDLYNKKYEYVFNELDKRLNKNDSNKLKNLYFNTIKQYLS